MNLATWFDTLRWPLEIVSILGAVAPFLIVVASWGALPENVPTHFGISGHPDRWGARWQIWILPVIAIALYFGMGTATGTLPWSTGEARVPGDALKVLIAARVLVGLLLSYIAWMTVRVARGRAERLNLLVFYTLIALLIAPGALIALRARH